MTPKLRLWTGRVLGALVALFFVWDAAIKVLHHPLAVEGTLRVGFPESTVLGIGVVELAATLAFVVPRTRLLGALLLTAFLGGATAAQVRLGGPFLFPVVFGLVAWASVLLRDACAARMLLGVEP